jgi:hypothetical protein
MDGKWRRQEEEPNVLIEVEEESVQAVLHQRPQAKASKEQSGRCKSAPEALSG